MNGGVTGPTCVPIKDRLLQLHAQLSKQTVHVLHATTAALQVTEQEPVAPTPADAIVMVQIDSTAASGPEQISQQLQALGSALKAAAAAKSLPLTALLVQYHSGVANAAPQTAPLTYFPGEQPAAAAAVAAGGSSQVGSFNDVLCEVKFRVSPNAFFQVRNSN